METSPSTRGGTPARRTAARPARRSQPAVPTVGSLVVEAVDAHGPGLKGRRGRTRQIGFAWTVDQPLCAKLSGDLAAGGVRKDRRDHGLLLGGAQRGDRMAAKYARWRARGQIVRDVPIGQDDLVGPRLLVQ